MVVLPSRDDVEVPPVGPLFAPHPAVRAIAADHVAGGDQLVRDPRIPAVPDDRGDGLAPGGQAASQVNATRPVASR
jgi:hypothetical protein